METLGLPRGEYATVMANAYAIMHCKARVDGDDVEFALGSSPISGRSQTLEELENGSPLVSRRSGTDADYTHRSIGMWLLDFNNCQRITLDSKGVEILVRRFGTTIRMHLVHPLIVMLTWNYGAISVKVTSTLALIIRRGRPLSSPTIRRRSGSGRQEVESEEGSRWEGFLVRSNCEIRRKMWDL